MAESTNPYTKLMEKAFSDAIPLNCQIEITYRCNHLCSFCYNSPTGQREMTTDEIFESLGKISEFGVLYVTLTGGEALCHKDFYEIAYEEAKAAGNPTSWGGWVYRLLCIKDEIGWEPFKAVYRAFTAEPYTGQDRFTRYLDELEAASGRDIRGELIPADELAWVIDQLN